MKISPWLTVALPVTVGFIWLCQYAQQNTQPVHIKHLSRSDVVDSALAQSLARASAVILIMDEPDNNPLPEHHFKQKVSKREYDAEPDFSNQRFAELMNGR